MTLATGSAVAAPKILALVSEPGVLRFPQFVDEDWNARRVSKNTSKNVSAPYRRSIIGRLLRNLFPIRRLMEAKNKP